MTGPPLKAEFIRRTAIENPLWKLARIADHCSCSIPYVSMVLRNAGLRPKRDVPPSNYRGKVLGVLSNEYYRWLEHEADRNGVSPAEIAAAMLNDAIYEAMEKEGRV